MSAVAGGPVSLDNCDQEPIHIPGLIQPHGALLAFDQNALLTYCSENAQALLGADVPALGERLQPHHLGADAGFHALMAQAGHPSLQDDGLMPHVMEMQGAGAAFDVIVHRRAGALVCEFEQRLHAVPAPASFSLVAHRAIGRLKPPCSADALLSMAVQELRGLTGFDRVMAYRFRDDDSGEVVAESADASLAPYLGLRYPASDIPAQARRLYLLNTLRLIADVHAVPVKVASIVAEPLDMSQCVLRSVSPVHIEYLCNMGVGASMSISIVVGGRLWGMLACLHRQPRRVPYAVRIACDVLAQVLAASVQTALAQAHAARADAAASLRARLVDQLLQAGSLTQPLSAESAALRACVGAHGMLMAEGAKVEVHGGLSLAVGSALVQWLNDNWPPSGHMIHMNTLEALPPGLRAQLGIWCGLLALPFGVEPLSWAVFLRKEEVETVMWGGKPEKEMVSGPFGPRLRPRSSFERWREIVRGQAAPWSSADLDIAQKLLDELRRVDARHIAEISRARNHLMAMLGHDLRNPLQSIANAAALLQKTGGDEKISQYLLSSSNRMQRLIDQVMDMSQLQNGSLIFDIQPVDLAEVLRQLVAESRNAYPGIQIIPVSPHHLMADADRDRIAQVLSNLLSNAFHHGAPGKPILVQLHEKDGLVAFEVSNTGAPIAPELLGKLFEPFKGCTTAAASNRKGLGLGLYIAQQMMAGHGGALTYHYASPYVVFTATFPVHHTAAGAGAEPLQQ